MAVKQLETFLEHMDVTPYTCSWEHFPTVNVIIKGTSTLSVGRMKRKFKELLSVNHLVQPERKSGERLKVRKTTRRGGGWIVFLKTSSLRSKVLFSGLESEWVQSLGAADNK